MPQGIRKHTCAICNRSFVKAEHLHRHQRSHTGDKPFVCERCGQRFTRFDSLSRHQRRQGHADEARVLTTQHSPGPTSSRADSMDLADDTAEMSALSSRSLEVELPHMNGAEVPVMLNTNSFDEASSLQPECAENGFMQLTWPDSEALLQSILNVNISSWPQSIEALSSQYLFQAPNQASAETQSPWLATGPTESSTNGTNAIRSISQIISDLSSNLASEAEYAVLSSTFLEACLHAFFEQMILVLPICHRPTFIFQDWTHPLLLNAIAVGSLFMGQDIDIAKGEVLWTLAHTAVATSWHSLIQHRGPYDTHEGAQLIMTALLGQTFAMLSGTSKLRSTAQIFHSLGFYWARQCGMYNCHDPLFLIEIANDSSEEQRLITWRKWAAEEVQLRALLGHYILDGQLTYFTGAPTCQRHTSNSLPFPSSDRLFTSNSLQEWTETLRTERPVQATFRDFFVKLFQGSIPALFQSPRVSFLVLQVVLEGLQSLVTDLNGAGCRVVGSPSLEAIETVIFSVRRPMQEMEHMTNAEKLQLLLRWHTICIDKAVNFNHLCKSLCSHLDIRQNIFGNAHPYLHNLDFQAWTRSRPAREALLHAVEVRNILSDLPIRAIHALHIPSTLFAAAVVYIAFVVGGVSSVSLPRVSNWSSLMARNDHAGDELSGVDKYLSNASFTATKTATSRNLLYDVNSFLLLAKQLRRPWAICDEIGTILHQMSTKCGA